MNAEPEFLASAYLDGELTDDERRLAEADPAVMAEVDQLRALRDQLATPPPPSDAAREAAIAAAMAEFGRSHGAFRSTATAPVVPYRPRPPWSAWLSAAAAVLVIGVLGVAIVAGVRGGDDDDSAATEPAAEEPAADDAAEDTARVADATVLASDADAAADEPMMEMADEPADMDVAGDELTEEPAAEEPAAEEPTAEQVEEPAEEPASVPAAAIGEPVEYLEGGRPITSPDELAAVGAYLAEQVEDRTIGATPEHACPFPNVLDTADVIDPLTGEQRPAYLDVAPEENLVRAIDQESCEVRLEAPIDRQP